MTGGLLQRLEGKSPTLFLVAAALLILFAVTKGIEAVTGSSPTDVFGPAGYTVAFVALLGMYPALAGRTPRLARVGGVVAVVGVVGWAAVTALTLAALAGVLPPPEEAGALGGAVLAPAGLGMLAGYLLFGVATLRSGAHPRALGLLLLAPAVIFAAVFAVFAPLGYGETWGPFLAASAQAVVHLAIGLLLRKEASQGRAGRLAGRAGGGAAPAT